MTDAMPPKVSIIVPVYKVEAYLRKCLDSILAQTFGDFELLLIDDGSPDGSGGICDEYASKDARIRVFHQANAGVSVARNTGLDNARGEWLSFVDSDDWVEPNWLEVFGDQTKSMVVASVDMFLYGYINASETETVFEYIPSRDRWDSRTILNSREAYIPALWSCFFRREIIERFSIRLTPTMKFAEDTEFLLKSFAVSKMIAGLKFVPYHYVLRGTSATNATRRDFDRSSMYLVAINGFLRFCIRSGIDNVELTNCVKMAYRMFLRVYLLDSNPEWRDRTRFLSLYDETNQLHPSFRKDVAWRTISQAWLPLLLALRALMATNRFIKSISGR